MSFIFGATDLCEPKVRFIGFNNMEEKELDELFLSKGEERRKEQESRGEGGIRFTLHQLRDFNMFVIILLAFQSKVGAKNACIITAMFSGKMRSMT